jgi:tetratricopeptide (TPR) repeat protein
VSFRHEYQIALETLASLASAEGGASPSGAADEAQVARSIGAILAKAGGKASVVAREGILQIGWTPSPEDSEPLEVAAPPAALREGRYPEGILVLRLLQSDAPHDPAVLYNLGMALSDVGELPAAIETLEAAVAVAPRNVNAQVALAVALTRAGETARAIPLLEAAVESEPDNPWAHRNLGTCLLQSGRAEEALPHFESVTALAPADATAHLGLAQAHEALGQGALADAEYRRTLELDEYGPGAEPAREGLSRLAKSTFRERIPGGLRMDAVMYLLDALTIFRGMEKKEIERITFEIAVLGRSGLDVNDPARRYNLTSLPGERSGLQLVSIMYAGMKSIAPDADAGFDLAAEYDAAISLRDAREGA